jgi:hypothetical protein
MCVAARGVGHKSISGLVTIRQSEAAAGPSCMRALNRKSDGFGQQLHAEIGFRC